MWKISLIPLAQLSLSDADDRSLSQNVSICYLDSGSRRGKQNLNGTAAAGAPSCQNECLHSLDISSRYCLSYRVSGPEKIVSLLSGTIYFKAVLY